ncbi:MAG: RecX family transcriptional regulator [Oscillospiraceae bacterium]|nr:RecX family transcriptional regulator [Oscillospiraceae bacterium]
MMRIDSVSAQPDRAGRYRVTLSDGSILRLYRQTVQDFGIYSGQELTQEEYEKLQKVAAQMSAKMRAVRIVSATSVSKQDLQQRLIQKGEDPAYARQAVSWMEEMHLLDDRRTAEQIVERCISKGYGVARAKQALYEKRIPKAYWEEVLEDYPEQEDAIRAYIDAHLPPQPDQKAVKKVIDALLRKGHSYGIIRRVLNSADVLED